MTLRFLRLTSRTWVICGLAALLVAALSAAAQELPPNRFETRLKFKDGRLVCDTKNVVFTERYKALLRPGVGKAQLEGQFCDAVDRELRSMPKPVVYALGPEQWARYVAGTLKDPNIALAESWSREFDQFPLPAFFEEMQNDFRTDLGRINLRSALAGYFVPDSDNQDRPRVFPLRDPFKLDDTRVDSQVAAQTPRIRKLLERLNGLPADPESIRRVVLAHYAHRGVTPRIDVDLDSEAKHIRVFFGEQTAAVLLPRDLNDFEAAQQVFYETMPHRVFRAFRRVGRNLLQQELGEGVQKREIELAVMVEEAEGEERDFQLPFAEAAALAAAQQRLSAIGFQWSLFERDPEKQHVDLVIDRTTQKAAEAPVANRILGTSSALGNSEGVTARPQGVPDLQAAPLTPADETVKRRYNPPRLEQSLFFGGGFEYRPGQGVRILGATHFTNLANGINQLTVNGGAHGGGIVKAKYLHDYVAFGGLGRRLWLSLDGGTDSEQNRVLAGVLTGERRSGAAARADLEVFRDRGGHQVTTFVSGAHETVRLSPKDGTERAANLSCLDLGLAYRWVHAFSGRQATFRIDPALRLGLALAAAEPAFRRLTLGASYRQALAGPVQAVSRLQLRCASAETPLFELPSLGGADSVRGFRSDDALGRRLWTLQNELWLPAGRPGADSGFWGTFKRNTRIAVLYDLGGMADAVSTTEGFRHGAGAGLRVIAQGVVLELDWAYGFGKGALGDGRGRFYFNIRLL